MYYSKKETYSFSCPREFKAYIAFKDKLREMGIKFTDVGGHTQQEITITSGGRFDVDENCDILMIDKEK